MKNIAFILAVITVFLLCVASVSTDAYGSYEGEQPSLDILIDKEVGVPQTTKGGKLEYIYVDNLTTRDHRFSPFDTVFFRIKVKNTSDQNLQDVVITDFPPEFVELFENPGTKDGSNLVIKVGDLKADEEKEYIVKARIFEQAKLPADKGLFCVVNRVRVEAKNNVSDEDTAQLCVEKEVGAGTPTSPGVKGGAPKKVPAAGAEHGVLLMGLSGLLSYVGLKLRKITA